MGETVIGGRGWGFGVGVILRGGLMEGILLWGLEVEVGERCDGVFLHRR